MLTKSKKNAFIMAGIFIFSGVISRTICEWIAGFETGIYGQFHKYHTEGAIIIPFLIFVPILLVAAGIVALFIYDWGDDHFGIEGAIRWGVAGMIYGSLKAGIDLLLGSTIGLRDFGRIANDLLGFLAIIASYLIVFLLIPFARKRFEEER